MMYRVVFLDQAEQDLFQLKQYILQEFSEKIWHETYQKIKKTILSLQTFPELGHIPPELTLFHLNQYRQMISGKNRILYEINNEVIYIHLICDARADLTSLLTQRIMR